MRLILLILLFSAQGMAQVNSYRNVIISTSPSSILPPSLIFDIDTTTKASKPVPSMTEVQRNALVGPLSGSFLWNSDSQSLDFSDSLLWWELPGANFVKLDPSFFPDPLLFPNYTLFNKENQLFYQSVLDPTGQVWRSTTLHEDFRIAYQTSGIIRTLDARVPTYNVGTGTIDNIPSFEFQFESEEVPRIFPGGDGYTFTILGTSTENRPLYIGISQTNPLILQARTSDSYADNFIMLGQLFIYAGNTVSPTGFYNAPWLAETSQSDAQRYSLYGFGMSGLLFVPTPGLLTVDSSIFFIEDSGINFYTNPSSPNQKQISAQIPVMFRNLITTAETDDLNTTSPLQSTLSLNNWESPAGTLVPVVAGKGYCGIVTMYQYPTFQWRYPLTESTTFGDSLTTIPLVPQEYITYLMQGEQAVAVLCYEGGITNFDDANKFRFQYLVGQASVAGGRVEPPDDSVERRHMEPTYRAEIESAIVSVDGQVLTVKEIVVTTTEPAQDGFYVLTQIVPAIGNQPNDIYERSGAVWTFIRSSKPGDMVMLDIIPPDATGFTNTLVKFTGLSWEQNGTAFNKDGVGINAGLTLDQSASLEMGGTTRGILIPRLTTAEKTAMAAPITPYTLLVDTDLQGFQFRTTAGTWSSFGDVLGPAVSNLNAFSLFADTSGKVIKNQATMFFDPVTSWVGIGTSTPVGALDVTSTNSGFLPPRMTAAERDAIVTPIPGMLIYNSTTNQLNVRNATDWGLVGGGNPLYQYRASTIGAANSTNNIAIPYFTAVDPTNTADMTPCGVITNTAADGMSLRLTSPNESSLTITLNAYNIGAGYTMGVSINPSVSEKDAAFSTLPIFKKGCSIETLGTTTNNNSCSFTYAAKTGDEFYVHAAPGTTWTNNANFNISYICGTSAAPPPMGGGDVNGPGTSVADNLTAFANTSGKLIKDSGIPLDSVIHTSATSFYTRTLATEIIHIGCGTRMNGQLNITGTINATWPAGALASAKMDIQHGGNDRGSMRLNALGQDGLCSPIDAVRAVNTAGNLCIGIRITTCGGAWGGGDLTLTYTPFVPEDNFVVALGPETNDNWSLVGQTARFTIIKNGTANDY